MSFRLILAVCSIAAITASAGVASADSDDHHSGGHVAHEKSRTTATGTEGCDSTDPNQADACSVRTNFHKTDFGAIRAISFRTHQITLTDGKRFVLPSSVSLAGLKIGEEVAINYAKNHHRRYATSVEVVG